jgi:hypothetical protein
VCVPFLHSINLAVNKHTMSTILFPTCDVLSSWAANSLANIAISCLGQSDSPLHRADLRVPHLLSITLSCSSTVHRESGLIETHAAQSIAVLCLFQSSCDTSSSAKARTCSAPHARSLWSSTCISLLNHRRCMLCGDSDQSLRQWRISLGLCLCVFFLLWLRQFCCTWSDDRLRLQCA